MRPSNFVHNEMQNQDLQYIYFKKKDLQYMIPVKYRPQLYSNVVAVFFNCHSYPLYTNLVIWQIVVRDYTQSEIQQPPI